MSPRRSIPLFLIALLLLGGTTHSLIALERKSGQALNGVPVEFDFESKELVIEDPITNKRTSVSTSELSLKSKQRLLFSPLLHQSYPGETMWPKPKLRLLGYAILTPTIALFLGFWIAGAIIGGKLNPFHAIFGFAGSWIVGTMFSIFYLFFAQRFQHPAFFTGAGVVMVFIFVPMFVSAVYNCSFLKGLGIFLFQLLAAFSLLAILLVSIELIVDRETLGSWWDKKVFEPVGLIQSSVE